MDFTGRHVVITGASSGIGLATAVKIVTLGGRVTLIARRADALEDARQTLGDHANFETVDVADKTRLLTALDRAVHRSGPIDGLFLNAALGGDFAPIWEYTDDTLEELLRVNVVSPFWAVRHVVPSSDGERPGIDSPHRQPGFRNWDGREQRLCHQ